MKSLLKFQHTKLCISSGFVEGAGQEGGWWEGRRLLAEGGTAGFQFSASGICCYKIILIVKSYTGCLSGRSLDTGETLLR